LNLLQNIKKTMDFSSFGCSRNKSKFLDMS
jgi:hypothetical protein